MNDYNAQLYRICNETSYTTAYMQQQVVRAPYTDRQTRLAEGCLNKQPLNDTSERVTLPRRPFINGGLISLWMV